VITCQDNKSVIYGNIHALIVQTVVYRIARQFVDQRSSFFDQDVNYGYKAAFQWRLPPWALWGTINPRCVYHMVNNKFHRTKSYNKTQTSIKLLR